VEYQYFTRFTLPPRCSFLGPLAIHSTIIGFGWQPQPTGLVASRSWRPSGLTQYLGPPLRSAVTTVPPPPPPIPKAALVESAVGNCLALGRALLPFWVLGVPVGKRGVRDDVRSVSPRSSPLCDLLVQLC